MHVRLRAHHYETSSASDAISCMAEARKSEPDLIILDLGLPGGDGFLLMDRFKNVPALASVPVIVVTGREVRGNLKRVIERAPRPFCKSRLTMPNSWRSSGKPWENFRKWRKTRSSITWEIPKPRAPSQSSQALSSKLMPRVLFHPSVVLAALLTLVPFFAAAFCPRSLQLAQTIAP